jgi:hypothetical protein
VILISSKTEPTQRNQIDGIDPAHQNHCAEPLGGGDRVEVLWWRRDAWGPAGTFGAVFDLDDALAFIADEPAFWIHT